MQKLEELELSVVNWNDIKTEDPEVRIHWNHSFIENM